MIGDFLKNSVLAFDPGGTTGVARLDAVWVKMDGTDIFGKIVYTYALDAENFFQFLHDHANWPGIVVYEASPRWGHHSPVTLKVEDMIKEMYPKATRVQPSQWKGHPRSLCPERLRTKHEKDVVRLARWFIARSSNAKSESQSNSSRAHRSRKRHQRNRA